MSPGLCSPADPASRALSGRGWMGAERGPQLAKLPAPGPSWLVSGSGFCLLAASPGHDCPAYSVGVMVARRRASPRACASGNEWAPGPGRGGEPGHVGGGRRWDTGIQVHALGSRSDRGADGPLAAATYPGRPLPWSAGRAGPVGAKFRASAPPARTAAMRGPRSALRAPRRRVLEGPCAGSGCLRC